MAEDIETEKQRALRHDIKNQLSNIYLAIEALRYEIADPSEDCTFYIESIASSAAKINSILTEK
jgi:hypothetical protein